MTTHNFIEKSDKWVSAETALPETEFNYGTAFRESKYVLLKTEYGDTLIGSLLYFPGDDHHDEEITWYEKVTEVELDDVTHWMSLPDSPGWEG